MENNYRGLIVWQKALTMAKNIYVLTEIFPKSQQYVLVSQMQRAAVSIPSNIAEGYNRQYTREYRQFLSIAYGSAGELETQIQLAVELGFAVKEKADYLLAELKEISKMLHVMIRNMKEAV